MLNVLAHTIPLLKVPPPCSRPNRTAHGSTIRCRFTEAEAGTECAACHSCNNCEAICGMTNRGMRDLLAGNQSILERVSAPARKSLRALHPSVLERLDEETTKSLRGAKRRGSLLIVERLLHHAKA